MTKELIFMHQIRTIYFAASVPYVFPAEAKLPTNLLTTPY